MGKVIQLFPPQSEEAKLRAALKEYGDHLGLCGVAVYKGKVQTANCTCGYEALITGKK